MVTFQGLKAELNLDDSALEGYYASAKFKSDCGDYVTAAATLKNYCDITQTQGVPGSGPNGMSALWGRLACEVCCFRVSVTRLRVFKEEGWGIVEVLYLFWGHGVERVAMKVECCSI